MWADVWTDKTDMRSFNSSSATIKAENDDERRPAQPSNFVHAGNILMPQDTLGRELLAIASSSQEHPPNGLYVRLGSPSRISSS